MFERRQPLIRVPPVDTRGPGRAAMAAHASQVPGSAVRRAGFAQAYGREWYRRAGAPGLLDEVAEPDPRAVPGTRRVAAALSG